MNPDQSAAAQVQEARTAPYIIKEKANIRLRAYIVGIPLVYLAGIWIFWGEMHLYTFCTWAAPFCNAVYILLVVTLVNIGVRKTLPGLALNRLELFAIYVMVSVGSAIMSSDMQGILVTLMGYRTYFASDLNGWDQLFAGLVPDWLTVTDKDALAGFYNGSVDLLRQPRTLLIWLKPIIPWTLFIWALMAMMLCVTTILRKAWVERERLTFPIVALPVALSEEPERLFKNKLMWIGFLVAGGITLLNGLNLLNPAVPWIQIKRWSLMTSGSGAMQSLGSFTISFYFFAIALGFLMPLDLSFSLYFFYFLYRFEPVFGQLAGVASGSRFPYAAAQSFGAYAAIFGVAIWGLRSYLRQVWEVAMGRGNPNEDANEPMRYRTAIIGFALSSLVLIGFAFAAGMSAIVAVLFFAIYLALAVMITRIRAEFGFPVHDMHEMGPGQTMVRTLGSEIFDARTHAVFSLFYWFNRVYRSHPMPHTLEAMRGAGTEPGAQRSMMRVMVIASMIAVPICFFVYLRGFYHFGAATAKINTWGTGYGSEAFGSLERVLKGAERPDVGDKLGTMFGFAFALLLSVMRRRFAGFPFHPLGYAVASSWGMHNLWLPIMVGSICKGAVMKVSGLNGYRKAVMLFFGLMLGEFAVGCSWILLGMATGQPLYEFWP